MVIGDFNIPSLTTFPLEADPPLIVNSDTVLTLSVAGEFFESVGWRHPEILKRLCGINHHEFSLSRSLDIRGQLPGTLASEHLFSLSIRKAPNHLLSLTDRVNNVKRYDNGEV